MVRFNYLKLAAFLNKKQRRIKKFQPTTQYLKELTGALAEDCFDLCSTIGPFN